MDRTYERAWAIRDHFLDALTAPFIGPNGTYLHDLTGVYGVF